MGKNLNILRKLIKEEIENIQLDEASLEATVDYLLGDELDEGRGRTSGTGKMFKLKGNHTTEDVEKFLKKIQSLIAKRAGKGRPPLNFTDEDIKSFSALLTKDGGFDAQDILNTISFYKGKPRQAAQKMMDILGPKKLTSNYDKNGNQIEIGKGYIEDLGNAKGKKDDGTKSEKPKSEKPLQKSEKPVDSKELESLEDDEPTFNMGDDEPEAPDDTKDVAPNEEPVEDEPEVEEPDEIEIDTVDKEPVAKIKTKGADELVKLEKKKDEILQRFKSGAIDINQYKQEIGDIPSKIKKLKAELEAELEVEPDDEILAENLVKILQRRAGILND